VIRTMVICSSSAAAAAPSAGWPKAIVRVPIIKTVATGTTSTVFVAPSLTTKGLTIKDIYLGGGYTNATGIVFGYGTSPSDTSEDAGVLALQTSLNDIAVPKVANDSSRFFSINVLNTSGASAEIKGYVSIEYEPAT